MTYSGEAFKKLLDGLINNLLNASHHFRLYRKLEEDALLEYEREINQCRAFWGLTISAHKEVSILNLCRAYDGNNQSLSLKRFLKVISENPELFDVESFRERLKDNPYVDSLAKRERMPNLEELTSEQKLVSNADPLVKKLTILRSNLIAHTNENWVLDDKKIEELAPLTFEEVEELIDRGIGIYNKYSSLFEASTYASMLTGEDDYQSVLKYYRIGQKFTRFFHDIEVDLRRRF
jgi:hypothetical protein